MGYKEGERVYYSLELDMQIYGKFWEELHSRGGKGHLGGSGTREGTPQFEMFVTEGKEKADGRSES